MIKKCRQWNAEHLGRCQCFISQMRIWCCLMLSFADQRLVTGSSDEIVFYASRSGVCFNCWTNQKTDCDRYRLSHCLITCFNDSVFWHCSKSYPDSYPWKERIICVHSLKEWWFRQMRITQDIVKSSVYGVISPGISRMKVSKVSTHARHLQFFIATPGNRSFDLLLP